MVAKEKKILARTLPFLLHIKVTELIYSATDGIILLQFLEYVTVPNITDICLLSLSLLYCMVKM